jgi:hypothetical protein
MSRLQLIICDQAHCRGRRRFADSVGSSDIAAAIHFAPAL